MIAASIIAASTSSLAVAYQISPNPNYGIINLDVSYYSGYVGDYYAENYLTPFENFGGIHIHAESGLENHGDFQNYGELILHDWQDGYIAGSGFFNMGSLSNTGYVYVGDQSGISGPGDISNSGSMEVSDYGMIQFSSFNNSGYVQHSGSSGNYHYGATLTNSGTIDNIEGLFWVEVFTNTGIFTNSQYSWIGDFYNRDPYALPGKYVQTDGQTINHGEIEFSSIEILGGSLGGTGALVGDVNIGSSATVIPGSSPGTLSIDGDLHSSGNYVFEIAGLNSGQYDVLDIDGNAFFTGGNFKFDFIDGFHPSIGDHWDFLVADSLNGLGMVNFTYAGLGDGLSIDLHNEGGKISLTVITAVPEPETYAMLLAGLGLMGFMAYRRKQKEAA